MAGSTAVKIRYEDADGDPVRVQSDDSLRYAFEDWRAAAQKQPRLSWRLIVEVGKGRH